MQFACIKLIQLFDVSSTLLTTPANASLLQPYLDRHSTAADVKLHVTPFPSSDLPVSCENTASIPSQELESVFFAAVTKLQEPIEQLVKQLRPDCVVADAMFSWTHDVFEEMGIPRIVFHGTSFFGCCALDSLIRLGIIDHDGDTFVIPGLAHALLLFAGPTRAAPLLPGPAWENAGDRAQELRYYDEQLLRTGARVRSTLQGSHREESMVRGSRLALQQA